MTTMRSDAISTQSPAREQQMSLSHTSHTNNKADIFEGMKRLEATLQGKPLDPRDPDHSREGIFVYHNCAYCDDGNKPCKQGSPNRCDNPRARND